MSKSVVRKFIFMDSISGGYQTVVARVWDELFVRRLLVVFRLLTGVNKLYVMV